MPSRPVSVDEYLAGLTVDRRAAVDEVRMMFRQYLDPRYAEVMQYGMIGYVVPHELYPAGYHYNPKEPLPFAGLASQKNHLSLYLMCAYGDVENEFKARYQQTGKKLDMGKACIRFKSPSDLALDVIGEFIREYPVERWIELYERNLKR